MKVTPPSPRLAVFLIVLLDIMGVGLLIPVQPFLAQQFGASMRIATLLGTTYSLMQFLLTPFWGGLSDRFGRKPILLVTILITFVGHAAFAVSNSLATLFIARALAGTGAANIAAAQAVLSDTHAPSERSRAMALIGVAFGVGFILGPLLGGVLSYHISPKAPAYLAALLAIVNLLFVWLKVPETRVASARASSSGHSRLLNLISARGQLRDLVVTTLLTMTAFAVMEQSISLYIGARWVPLDTPYRVKEASRMTMFFLVTVGISAIFVQGILVRHWLKTAHETLVVRTGLAILIVGLLLVPILGSIGSFPIFLASGSALALGSGLFNPAMAGLVSKSCSEDDQGLGLAMNHSAVALGRIMGPTVAGMLLTWHLSLPFIVGALLTGAALWVSSRIVGRTE